MTPRLKNRRNLPDHSPRIEFLNEREKEEKYFDRRKRKRKIEPERWGKNWAPLKRKKINGGRKSSGRRIHFHFDADGTGRGSSVFSGNFFGEIDLISSVGWTRRGRCRAELIICWISRRCRATEEKSSLIIIVPLRSLDLLDCSTSSVTFVDVVNAALAEAAELLDRVWILREESGSESLNSIRFVEPFDRCFVGVALDRVGVFAGDALERRRVREGDAAGDWRVEYRPRDFERGWARRTSKRARSCSRLRRVIGGTVSPNLINSCRNCWSVKDMIEWFDLHQSEQRPRSKIFVFDWTMTVPMICPWCEPMTCHRCRSRGREREKFT